MAVTLSTYGNYEAGTTGIGQNDFVGVVTTTAQDVTLPAAAPNGFKFYLERKGANVATLIAPSGFTLVGISTLSADGETVLVVKTDDAEYTSYLLDTTS